MSAESYKRWHKPNANAKTHQGYYKITKPEKYIGSASEPVIYRSDWERRFCVWCEMNDGVLRWSSEPISIKYPNIPSSMNECRTNGLNINNPVNWKWSNYHIDFWIEIKKTDGVVEKWVIEIKPNKDRHKPTPIHSTAPLKEQRAYVNAAKTWLINSKKWEYANKYCEDRGWKFYVFDEHVLEKLGIMRFK